MIREIFKKEDYLPISQLTETQYHLMWGKVDLVDRTLKIDDAGNVVLDDNGEPIVIDEKETDLCSCVHEILLLPQNEYTLGYLGEKAVKNFYERPTLYDFSCWADVILSEDKRIPFMQDMLSGEISRYDSSNAVNEFTIGGVSVWLDKGTRVGLKLRFEAEIVKGLTETTLWFNGMNFTLPLTGDNSAVNMLYAIEIYASECYDNTQRHLKNAGLLDSIEEIIRYDYTTGYPPKLAF